MSEDRCRAITVIAFIGSVFSPYYRWSGRRDATNHICINVATYGPGGRFAMTERGREALIQETHKLVIGPSSLRWTGNELHIHIDERGAPPIFGKLRGRVTVIPTAITPYEAALTRDDRHIWRPFAPVADIRVELDADQWTWQGHGYFDANFGLRPLESDFDSWTWGRFPTTDGATVFYDAALSNQTSLNAAIAFSPDGTASEAGGFPFTDLKRSRWALRRETRADPNGSAREIMSMLDAPFYSRSLVQTRLNGVETVGVHETLSLVRFRSAFLMPMLACRIPRRRRWNHQKQTHAMS